MKGWFLPAVVWFVLVSVPVLGPIARAESASESDAPVYVIPVKDEINVATTYLIRRGLKAAMDAEARAVILDMDTYGGNAKDTEEILTILSKFKGKTATFIDNKAISAGAFISFGTAEIYMAPGGSIGAAAIVFGSPDAQVPERVVEKYNSAFRAIVRSKAEKFGHNPAVIDAMVDQDKGLTIDGKEIVPKGKLLTLTTKEAIQKYGKPPKPLLAKAELTDIQQVADAMGFPNARIVRVEATGAETVAHWITVIAPLLLMIGIAALYIEFKTPGFGIPGTVAVIAFAIFFFGHYIAGIAGHEPMVLFIIGVVLVAVEIFHPGLIAPAVLGMLAILVALFMGMADFYPTGDWSMPEAPDLMKPALNMIGAMVLSGIAIYVLNRVIPKQAYSRAGIVLDQPLDPDKGYVSSGPSRNDLVGRQGTAMTPLRPAGKARIGDEVVDVMTEGERIEQGTAVRVISVEGACVTVQKL